MGDFNQTDREIQKLVIQKNLEIEKALYSDNPDEILKAQAYLTNKNTKKDSGNAKAWTWMPEEYSYSGKKYKESYQNTVSFEHLKRISRLFIVRLIHDTRIDQVKNFLEFTTDDQKEGFTIVKNKGIFDTEVGELSKKEQQEVSKIVEFLKNCGNNSKWDEYDDFYEFTSKILRDSLTYDQFGFETIRNNYNDLDKFLAVDGALIRRLDSDDPRHKEQFKHLEWRGYLPRYCMSWNGQILENPQTKEPIIFYPWELGYGVRNKTSAVQSNGYGTSELETGIQLVNWILSSFTYNGNVFDQESLPKGFLNIKSGGGDNTTIQDFRDQWRKTMMGVEACLHGDTFIVTENGRRSLDSFFIENGDDKKFKIWTGKKFENALVWKTKEDKLLTEITTNNGMSIKCSPDHRFKTVNENGDIVWKTQSDLSIGDFLMVNKKSIPNNDIIYYKGIEVESDLFETIGWMIGDGWIGEDKNKKRRCSLVYHQDYEVFIQKYQSLILSKYNINNSFANHIRSEKDIEEIRIKKGYKTMSNETRATNIVDSDFHNFLMSLGFTSSKEGKVIPDFMFSCNPKYRRAFLRGFFSADCYSKDGRYISMSITDNRLRQQTKELLLSEGIRCGNYEGEGVINSFTGKISDGCLLGVKDNDLFYKRIGLLHKYKGYRENEYKFYSVKESCPPSLCKKELQRVKDQLKKRRKETGKGLCNARVTNDISAALTGKSVFSFNKFENTYNSIKNYLGEDFELSDETVDFHYEKITDIKNFNNYVQMYDIQVFDNENQFIANGYLTHNSRKIAVFEGIDLEWNDMSQKNRDMEFNQWLEFLIVVFCAVYKIDPSELGFSFNQAAQIFGQDGQKNRLEHSKSKGLKPLLIFLQKTFNKYLIEEINPAYKFKFTGIDLEDEEAQVELDTKKLAGGMISFEAAFEKYMGREFDPEKDTILNQVFQQAQQAKMYGGTESNDAVDEMTGEGDQGIQNPFEVDYEKAQDPFTAGLFNYIDKTFQK